MILNELSLNITALLIQKSMNRPLTEYEAHLYEAASRYSTTVLHFANNTTQSCLEEAERTLDDQREAG